MNKIVQALVERGQIHKNGKSVILPCDFLGKSHTAVAAIYSNGIIGIRWWDDEKITIRNYYRVVIAEGNLGTAKYEIAFERGRIVARKFRGSPPVNEVFDRVSWRMEGTSSSPSEVMFMLRLWHSL